MSASSPRMGSGRRPKLVGRGGGPLEASVDPDEFSGRGQGVGVLGEVGVTRCQSVMRPAPRSTR